MQNSSAWKNTEILFKENKILEVGTLNFTENEFLANSFLPC